MTVTPDSADLEGTDRKAVASMLIIKAKSLEDVKAMIESDIYYTSGVVSGDHVYFFSGQNTETDT